MTERAWDSERIDGIDDVEDDVELDSGPLEESEVLDADNVLGMDADSDEIDDSWDAPERPSPAARFWTTIREQRDGSSIARFLAQEQPEPDPYVEAERLESEASLRGDADYPWIDDEPGRRSASTLVADDEGAHPDRTSELIAHEAGPPAAQPAAGTIWPAPPEEDAIHIEQGG
jgi:hypothetical protein